MQTDATPLEAFYFRDFKNSYIPHILEEIYLKKVYAPFVEGKKDLTIVDIGANVGLTAYYFKDYGKVYAVEPSRRHLEALEAMIKQNRINNIKVCPYAISNENGKTKFYHNDNVTMYSLKDTVNKKDDFEEVETVTLEELMKREDIKEIDILKLDAEGWEGEIVTSEGFTNVADKIKVIAGEWHSWGSMSQSMFANALSDLGFEFTWVKGTDAQCFTAVRV